MPHVPLPLFIAICLLLVVFFLSLFVPRGKSAGRHGGYKARNILTANEVEFFGRLRSALPHHNIFPQVAMSALIEPKATGKQRMIDFRRMSQKRVDFAVFDSTLKLLAIVELDDSSHNAERDVVRDEYTKSAGIRTLRYSASKRPSVEVLRAAIAPAPASSKAPFVRTAAQNASSEEVTEVSSKGSSELSASGSTRITG
jgi:hypothetical protein